MEITRKQVNQGVSQVARAVGVHHSVISRFARGERTPNKKMAKRLKRFGIEFPAAGAAAK